MGGNTAYVGFTGGTGGLTATQEILSWTFSPSVGFGSGFSGAGMTLNGNTTYNGTRLRLTDGGTFEASSAFYSTVVNVQSFATDFSFQLTQPNADGMTFTLHGGPPTALGSVGGALGYEGMAASVAVKFDLYNNAGEGVDSTGLYINGAYPSVPALDMTSSGVNLHSGDVFNVHLGHNGTVLTLIITDASNSADTFTTSWTIDIPATIGGSTAYVGFTGSSGGLSAIQEILSWTFVPGVNFGGGFTGVEVALNGTAAYNGTRVRLTDGGAGEAASAFYAVPINIQHFVADFSFQLTNPNADGITFTLQGRSPTQLGSAGGGLGYGGINSSVAVKFDLYNNAGEGINSKGVYFNGVYPSLPAADMTSSGVNLHNGDIFNVHITYNGNNLTMTITDASNSADTFSIKWAANIPSTLGNNSAYMGFTGGTGGLTATQEIVTWSFN